MITGDSSGDVDGLVVLEIGRKDVAKEAQSNDVVVFGPTDGCSERAESDHFLSSGWPAKLLRFTPKMSSGS